MCDNIVLVSAVVFVTWKRFCFNDTRFIESTVVQDLLGTQYKYRTYFSLRQHINMLYRSV